MRQVGGSGKGMRQVGGLCHGVGLGFNLLLGEI